MSLFAFLGGRHDTKAWARALQEAGCKAAVKYDRKLFRSTTSQMIAEDCETIEQAAEEIMSTDDPKARRASHLVMFSRFSRLSKLLPYASRKQKKKIARAKQAVAEARQYR